MTLGHPFPAIRKLYLNNRCCGWWTAFNHLNTELQNISQEGSDLDLEKYSDEQQKKEVRPWGLGGKRALVAPAKGRVPEGKEKRT